MKTSSFWLVFCLMLALCLSISACSAPQSNHVAADDGVGGSNSHSGSFLVGTHAALGFFTVLHPPIEGGRACRDADLTRVDDHAAKVDKIRVTFLFTSAPSLGEGVVLKDGNEVVVSLYCADLAPECVRVDQRWHSPNTRIGLCQEVDETDNEPFSYDISKSATEMRVVYNDGTRDQIRTIAINEGDLVINK